MKGLLAKNDNNISLAVQKSNFASDVDREGMAHDIRYVLSDGSDAKIREADEKFVKVLSKMKGDNINVLIPLNAMRAKIIAEKSGALKVYGGDERASEADKKLLREVLAHLEQQGFGKKRPKRGGARLHEITDDHHEDLLLNHPDEFTSFRGVGKKPAQQGQGPSRWIAHVKSVAKENGVKYGDALKMASKTYKK